MPSIFRCYTARRTYEWLAGVTVRPAAVAAAVHRRETRYEDATALLYYYS